MKKLAIASASMALAAMPVVGVFAADAGSASVVDTVKVNIAKSCTFQATQNSTPFAPDENGKINRSFEKSATLGQVVYLGDGAQGGSGAPSGSDITIQGVCNSGGSGTQTGTWSITAAGDNNGDMIGSTSGTSIPSPDTQLSSGKTSGWNMKIADATTTYSDFKKVPGATGVVVASGTADGQAFSFKPQYRVYVGTEQASGTYTGVVTYTIASTWSGN